MNANELQNPEVPESIKRIIHAFSILLFPVFFSIKVLIEGDSAISVFFYLLLCSIPFTLAYYIAGGFNWKRERLSTFNIILYLFLTFFFWGLVLYAYWYLVRFIVSKLSNTPLSALKGKMFTRDSLNEQMKNLKKLFDDGLISEEDYETKKKEILANM